MTAETSARIIAHLCSADRVMAGLIRARGPLRLSVDAECPPFQALARAIAHQQLHAVAANTILQRFVDRCGEGKFPTPELVLAASTEALRAIGFSFAKIAALKDLAEKSLAGIVPDAALMRELSDAEIIARLTQVRGIGRWTVEMMLMFQLGRPDVLPVDDFGIRNGFRLAYGLRKLPPPRALALFGERWSPHRTAAAWYLWRANEMYRAGTLPEPVERVRLPRVRRAISRVKRAMARANAKMAGRSTAAGAAGVRKGRSRPARR